MGDDQKMAGRKPEIELRLENWGAWSKSAAPNSSSRSSPLYRLYAEANPGTSDPVIRSVDDEDAWKVERAISRVCLMYERNLLKFRFIAHMRPGLICRKCGIEPHSFERELDSIERKLEIELDPAYNDRNLKESM